MSKRGCRVGENGIRAMSQMPHASSDELAADNQLIARRSIAVCCATLGLGLLNDCPIVGL